MQRFRLNAERNIGFSPTVSARVEGGRDLLQRLLPPARHEAPAHGHELARAVAGHHDVNARGRADVVPRLEVPSGPDQAVPLVHLAPGEPLSEASAHAPTIAGTDEIRVNGRLPGSSLYVTPGRPICLRAP